MFTIFPRASDPPATEQRTIELAGNEISYVLKRTAKRRTIGLRIDDDGLTVAMPVRASERWLHSVLEEKAQWILEKLAGWQKSKPAPIRWEEGQPLPFMGEHLTLRVVASLFHAPPLVSGRQLFVHVTDATNPEIVEQAVLQWYRRQAEPLFRDRVAHYAPLLGVAPTAVKLSSARTQWGSCNVRGVVHLNWQLIKMPLRLLDYVVVHELAHLIEMNHSAAFWQVVKGACPGYAKLRKDLTKWGTP